MDVRHPMQIIYTSGTTGDPKGVMIRNNRTGVFNIMSKIVWKYKPNRRSVQRPVPDPRQRPGRNLFSGHLYMGIKAVFSPKFTKSRIWDVCRAYGCTGFSLLGGMMPRVSTTNRPKPDDNDNPVKTWSFQRGHALRPSGKGFEKRFNVKILEWYGAVEGRIRVQGRRGPGPHGILWQTRARESWK